MGFRPFALQYSELPRLAILRITCVSVAAMLGCPLRRWVVSLHIRSQLISSLCYATLPYAILRSTRLRLARPLYATFYLRRWVVSLHLRSFLTASLCLAPLIHAERFLTVPNPAKLRSALFRTSGRYRSVFGLSSLAPFAILHQALLR